MYVDPGTMMPFASAVAAVTGVLLMFWQRVVGAVKRLFGRKDAATSSAGAADPSGGSSTSSD